MTVYSPGSRLKFFHSALFFCPYLVLHGALVQCVQLSAQLVHLVTDFIHLGTKALITGQIGVKLLLVLAALLVRDYLWVQPGVGY